MRNSERFRKLRDFVRVELCEGRRMKSPREDQDVTDPLMREPSVYLAWRPMHADASGYMEETNMSGVAPGILIMPTEVSTDVAYTGEDGGGTRQTPSERLSVILLFSIWEPGIRLPGVRDDNNNVDITRITDGTEEGFMTLTDWMDDAVEAFRGKRIIPGTDLSLDPESVKYNLYTDEKYVMDTRPMYHGLLTLELIGAAEEKPNKEILDLLL